MNPTNTTTMNKESYNFMDVPKIQLELANIYEMKELEILDQIRREQLEEFVR